MKTSFMVKEYLAESSSVLSDHQSLGFVPRPLLKDGRSQNYGKITLDETKIK